jgi:uridylate kinase
MKADKIVMSLGGSLVVPDEIDVVFLNAFKDLILKKVALGQHFYIIVGGGKTCRKYQQAGEKVSKITNDDLDMIGIYACSLNAMLVKSIFGDKAYSNIVTDMKELDNIHNPIVILAPHAVGSSSDLGAVQIAKTVGAKKAINLSNIDYAYDKDPNKYPDAKKIKSISWADYRSLIPKEWNPGLSTPFDPIASKMAEASGVEVVILNGKNISNLEKCLNDETFAGTQIK